MDLEHVYHVITLLCKKNQQQQQQKPQKELIGLKQMKVRKLLKKKKKRENVRSNYAERKLKTNKYTSRANVAIRINVFMPR